MSTLRLYSILDSGVSAYLRPFWADHKENAQRSFRQLVNDESDPNNMVHNYPHQFSLFELGIFSSATGAFTSHDAPICLGLATEYLRTKDNV